MAAPTQRVQIWHPHSSHFICAHHDKLYATNNWEDKNNWVGGNHKGWFWIEPHSHSNHYRIRTVHGTYLGSKHHLGGHHTYMDDDPHKEDTKWSFEPHPSNPVKFALRNGKGQYLSVKHGNIESHSQLDDHAWLEYRPM